jgi:hypothetical protein
MAVLFLHFPKSFILLKSSNRRCYVKNIIEQILKVPNCTNQEKNHYAYEASEVNELRFKFSLRK